MPISVFTCPGPLKTVMIQKSKAGGVASNKVYNRQKKYTLYVIGAGILVGTNLKILWRSI